MSPAIRNYTIGILIFVVSLAFGQLQVGLTIRLALGVLALHYVWRACTAREGSSHPMGLYLLFSGLYVYAAFSEVALFGNRLNLDSGLMGDLADMGAGFLFFAAAGYLVCRRTERDRGPSVAVSKEMVTASIFSCLLLFAVSTTIILLTYGGSIGSISRAELYSAENSLLTVIRGVIAIGLGVSAALLVTYEDRIGSKLNNTRLFLFGTLGAYVAVDLLIMGDRRLPLMAIMGVAALLLPKRFTWRQIIVVSVLGVTFFLYGYVRNTPPSQWIGTITSGDILLAFSPASTEFGGLAFIGQAIGNFDYSLAGFPTYIDGVVQLFPRALVENRPLSPTEWFIQSYYPDLAAVGASYAFNQVIEARMNLGLLGIAVVGVITGSGIAWLASVRFFGAPVGIPLCINVFCFSMRMDMVSIVRTGIIATFGMMVILMIAVMARRNVIPTGPEGQPR